MKITLVLAAAASLAYGADLQDHETIRQNFPAATRLNVDNVSGSIHVVGYSGGEIQMVAEKTIHAESQDRLDAAKREVKLNITQSGGELKLLVDGPFRDHGIHDHGHRGYNVRYDFELKVPVATAVQLANVNGHTRVEATTGGFDLSSVNGEIEMSEISGSGHAETVNGKISAVFAQNPSAASSFKTVNGAIEASFRANLSADIRVKTFHGGAYTDFDATALPNVAPVAERHNGKFIYRAGNTTSLRIGAGGPELKFETLNGSIRIIKRGQ